MNGNDDRRSGHLLVAATSGIGAAALLAVLLPDTAALQRAVLQGIVLIVVSLVAYRFVSRRRGG